MTATATSNPLYEQWAALGMVRGISLFGFDFPNAEADFDAHFRKASEAMRLRDKLTSQYSWAIPSPEAIAWIAGRCPRIVEIGAGRGYWAKLLSEAGVSMLAFDETGRGDHMTANNWHWLPSPTDYQKQRGLCGDNKTFFPVRQGSSEKATEHSDRTLMLCWPPYDTTFAADCLNAYRGDELLFIGEYHGATGDEAFFALIESDWTEAGDCDIPQWYGMRDSIWLYRRKTPTVRKFSLDE